MNTERALDEVLEVTNRADLREVGGSHAHKGIDFQRYWAVARMVELEQNGASDFLLLFEAIQDVAELDSCTNPTSIRVYQVKKKDNDRWSWNDLTSLKKPTPSTVQDFEKIRQSPLGKLYVSVIAIASLTCEGLFVSNATCDLELMLDSGIRVCDTMHCNLASLANPHRDLLVQGLKVLHSNGDHKPDPGKITLQKVHIPPGDPYTFVVGEMHKFLDARYPKHAGQARSLVDTLIARISPLGARTEFCLTFDEMRKERGYSHSDFLLALTKLAHVPDEDDLLRDVCGKLFIEGLDLTTSCSMHLAMGVIQTDRLLGRTNKMADELDMDCDEWLLRNALTPPLLPKFEQACAEIGDKHSAFHPAELMAHLVMRVVKKCVDQISED